MKKYLTGRQLGIGMLLWLVVMTLPVERTFAAHPVLDPAVLTQAERELIVIEQPVTKRVATDQGTREQSQMDWMVSLVDACGWSFGLPDDPRTEDYLKILAGTRLLRIEAEEAKQELDSVSVKSFRTYGRFSGSGWVSGIASPTKIHMKFLVPLTGAYRLTANLRLAGFRFHLGEHELSADGGRGFGRVELGTVELLAGPQEVVVDIPPNASIDYLELEGEHALKIAPAKGWKPDELLTREVVASTALQVLGLEYLLPLSGEELAVEAEVVAATDRAKIISARHLGAPSGGKWLRMGAGTARVELPLTIDRAGLYQISMRAAASRPVKVSINGRIEKMVTFPSYLDARVVGTFRLNPGANRISVELPPRAGVDVITLRRHSDADKGYLQLVGLAGEERPLTDVANDLLRLLAMIGPSR